MNEALFSYMQEIQRADTIIDIQKDRPEEATL